MQKKSGERMRGRILKKRLRDPLTGYISRLRSIESKVFEYANVVVCKSHTRTVQSSPHVAKWRPCQDHLETWVHRSELGKWFMTSLYGKRKKTLKEFVNQCMQAVIWRNTQHLRPVSHDQSRVWWPIEFRNPKWWSARHGPQRPSTNHYDWRQYRSP